MSLLRNCARKISCLHDPQKAPHIHRHTIVRHRHLLWIMEMVYLSRSQICWWKSKEVYYGAGVWLFGYLSQCHRDECSFPISICQPFHTQIRLLFVLAGFLSRLIHFPPKYIAFYDCLDSAFLFLFLISSKKKSLFLQMGSMVNCLIRVVIQATPLRCQWQGRCLAARKLNLLLFRLAEMTLWSWSSKH